MLYLFSGAPRKADIREYLQQFAVSQNFALDMREVDIERGLQDDLTKSDVWNSILQDIKAARYQVIVLSPPCGTWSRVRFQWKTSPGPRSMRNWQHPWGFPWLSNLSMRQVENANMFVLQSLEAASCVAALGGFYNFEHPEDLGLVHEERPASIWQLPQMQQLQVDTGATTFALFQCAFGADSPKPTRFLSNIPGAKKFAHRTWPRFDFRGRYLGPVVWACISCKEVDWQEQAR